MSNREEMIEKLTRLIEEHLADAEFGVGELATALSVSRSTLLRLIRKYMGMSANEFIRQVRLEQAKLLLIETDKTISEISYETGFSSSSYLIKCFREKYGAAPGEFRQLALSQGRKAPISESLPGGASSVPESAPNLNPSEVESPDSVVAPVVWFRSSLTKTVFLIGILIVVFLSGVLYLSGFWSSRDEPLTKGRSIAVLPFKNESADSTNVYFINGIMESILGHLQRIEDLRVISRTSVEKYRHQHLTAPEIARELGVDYIVEGSGQKRENQILLSVQLIGASEDRHLWSQQYKRELSDVFALQAEVSKNIASRIEVVIQPLTKAQLEEVPTENMEAYDLYLKGMDFIRAESLPGLDSALSYYYKAIDLDPSFANPYAYAAVCYYYKDFLLARKEHLDELDRFSDKALLLNSDLPESLIARGMYQMQTGRYTEAREYFERVLEISPNSVWIHNFLSEIYNQYLPDTEKYLIHALSAMQLDFSDSNPKELSVTHLIVANAFSQSGILDKAKEHIRKSLEFDPDNIFSLYVDIYIDLAQDENLDRAVNRMASVFQRDTTRLDVLQELTKLSYVNGDFKAAYRYADQFVKMKEKMGYLIFPEFDILVAVVFRQQGQTERAKTYRDNYQKYLLANKTLYRPLNEAFLYLYDGKREQALDALERFASKGDSMYWIILMLDKEPLVQGIRNDPRFKTLMKQLEKDFTNRRNRRISTLKEMGLWDIRTTSP